MNSLEAQHAHYKQVRARIARSHLRLVPAADPPPAPVPVAALEPPTTMPHEDREALGDIPQRLWSIVFAVAKKHGVTISDLLVNRCRKAHLVAARHELYYELRHRPMTYYGMSAMLKRDHATLINGVRRHIENMGGSDGDAETRA